MACPNQESLTIHNSKEIYTPLATNRANTQQVYASMKLEIINYV